MFTILIEEPNGNTRLRGGALEVRYVSDPSHDLGRGLLIRWEDGLETHLPEAASSDTVTTVYVMNERGATVGTYRP